LVAFSAPHEPQQMTAHYILCMDLLHRCQKFCLHYAAPSQVARAHQDARLVFVQVISYGDTHVFSPSSTQALHSSSYQAVSVVPEQCQQNDYRQRNAKQPQQSTSSKAHDGLPFFSKFNPHCFCKFLGAPPSQPKNRAYTTPAS
jgi:hypothetical protein